MRMSGTKPRKNKNAVSGCYTPNNPDVQGAAWLGRSVSFDGTPTSTATDEYRDRDITQEPDIIGPSSLPIGGYNTDSSFKVTASYPSPSSSGTDHASFSAHKTSQNPDSTNKPVTATSNIQSNKMKHYNKNAMGYNSPKASESGVSADWPYTPEEQAENDKFWKMYNDKTSIWDQDFNSTKSSGINKNNQETADDIFDHPELEFLKDINEPKEMALQAPAKPKRKMKNLGTIGSTIGTDRTGIPIASSADTTLNNKKSKTMPSRYYETAEKLSELVVEKGLVIKDVFPDGNCLFAATVDQLRVCRDFTWTTKSLRDAAVQYLTDNPCQADGTPLYQFLTEHDGTWEEYLSRMRREGEWGDHFVISALANVLKRRIVILRGYNKLTTTIMEPSFFTEPNQVQESKDTISRCLTGTDIEPSTGTDIGTSSGDDTGASFREDVEPSAGAKIRPSRVKTDDREGGQDNSKTGAKSDIRFDDVCLGHIAEAHYVSLRHVDWEDRFFKDKGNIQECLTRTPFPQVHLDSLLRYLHNDFFTWSYSSCFDKRTTMKDFKTFSSFLVGDVVCGLDMNMMNMDTGNKWASNRQKNREFSMYLTPNDTTVYMDENSNSTKKDLITVETDCPLGYTKLTPVQPYMWQTAIEQEAGGTYLRQLHLICGDTNMSIALKCVWPTCCLEYLTRERISGWPAPCLISKLEKNGVYVIPEASQTSTKPAIEWKFSFKHAEKLLCKSLNKYMKHGHFFLKSVCEHLFGNKNVLNETHLKTVFFYMCEEIPRENFADKPGCCLHQMLNKLCHYLAEGNLPGYFMAEINLISEIEELDLQWHIEQVRMFQAHVLECVFLMFDRNDLLKWFGLGKCLDMLISDIPKYLVHNDLGTSFRECFMPVHVLCIQNLVTTHSFQKAQSQCESLFQESTAYFESLNGREFLLQNVMVGLPIQEQWLFAFFMDYMIGSTLLHFVCQDRECTSLESLFGKRFTAKLSSCTQSHMRNVNIPNSIVYRENVVSFAQLFTYILNWQIDKDVCKLASCFFLKHNTVEILEEIAMEEKAGDYHTGHSNMKTNLHKMFSSLYNIFDEDREWMKFYDLMEEYDLLSQHYQHAHLSYHVYIMWDNFNCPGKANEAWARYQSLTS